MLEAAARRREEAATSSMIELQMQVQTMETEAMQAQQLLTLALPAASHMKLTEQVQTLVQLKQSSEEEAKALLQVHWQNFETLIGTLLPVIAVLGFCHRNI